MKVIHVGLDYTTIEVGGEEFEVSIALGEAINKERELYKKDIRQGKVDI